jgi:hypothetical protein
MATPETTGTDALNLVFHNNQTAMGTAMMAAPMTTETNANRTNGSHTTRASGIP